MWNENGSLDKTQTADETGNASTPFMSPVHLFPVERVRQAMITKESLHFASLYPVVVHILLRPSK